MTTFADKYAPKYDKAVECLIKDRRYLLTFFDFPADHWDHLRTTNPIESVFATVRHRTVRMKGALSQDTARLMVFKLVIAASKTWRRLQGQNQLPKIINGANSRTESKSRAKQFPPPDPRRHPNSNIARAAGQAAFGSCGDLRRRDAHRGGEDRRGDASDRSRLGDEVQRAGTGRLD